MTPMRELADQNYVKLHDLVYLWEGICVLEGGFSEGGETNGPQTGRRLRCTGHRQPSP
jgi:hypothetical protein